MHAREIQARNLYEKLTQEVSRSSDNIDITFEGAGSFWHCQAEHDERECYIECLDSFGYAIIFNAHNATEAEGRSKSEEQVILAVINWLQNRDLSEIYKLFEFVDYNKRLLSKITDTFTNEYPNCIQEIDIKLNQNFGGNFHLELEAKDRFCKVYLLGGDKSPTYDFYWDACLLFSCTEKDAESLLLMMKLWLYDYYTPSQLEQNFLWLDTGKLAKYYEDGRGIEGEFVLSWDHIEEFYSRQNSFILNTDDILEFIAQLREKGFDKTLRAGQSMRTFIVSRARRHGFMTQYIAFDFITNGMKVTVKLHTEQSLSLSSIELTPEVDELIKQLEAKDLELAPKFWR